MTKKWLGPFAREKRARNFFAIYEVGARAGLKKNEGWAMTFLKKTWEDFHSEKKMGEGLLET